MQKTLSIVIVFLFLWGLSVEANPCDLFRDLLTVQEIDRCLCDRLPVMNNYLLYGGYFNMPSASMGKSGAAGMGWASLPPYRIWSLRWQLAKRLELSGNYRVFSGVDDPILTPHGFGDKSDKGANLKLLLLKQDEVDDLLPGIAIGWEDFMGTKAFEAQYIVATYAFLQKNFEISLGWGRKRIRGFFGGVRWLPFRNFSSPYFKGISLVAEYDAIPYESGKIEPHPDGRTKRTPINFGMHYSLCDMLEGSLSYVRGNALAASISLQYNFGTTKGFLPKIHDPLPYTAPVNIEPLGKRRPKEILIQDLLFPFRDQGFDMISAKLSCSCNRKQLRLVVENTRYRFECDVRMRLNNLLARLIPCDVNCVIVTLHDEGIPVQEYRFDMDEVRAWAACEMCSYELNVLTPLKEVSFANSCSSETLYLRSPVTWNFELFPKARTFFGSAKGKFKYVLGISSAVNGFLYPELFYSLRGSYTFVNDAEVGDTDILNPSQLINVQSDRANYYKQKGFTLDEGYLQKNWNFCRGLFGRIAAGYFEQVYGGVAVELLYYPVNSLFAVGLEGAKVKKRKFSGLGFFKKIRKLDGTDPSFVYFNGFQYFVDIYYRCERMKLDFKVKAGKFLANDYGARYEVTRYYDSGLRLTFWYTHTNGHDKINGKTYYDKGVAISLPLDIFYTHSQRSRTGYGMSAWLRDVGVSAKTGKELYPLIRSLRD